LFPLKDSIGTDRTPVVTIALIAANVIIFFLSIRSGGSLWGGPADAVVVDYGVIPYELTHFGDNCEIAGGSIACEGQAGVSGTGAGQPSTIVTVFSSMFLHGGLLHIAGNMLFLWVFGNNIEDAMGRVKFLVFYLLAGIAAAALQTAIGPDEVIPAVGASGAVAGVLGAYLILYPRAKVLTLVFLFVFFTFIQIPAIFFLGFWIAQQIVFGYLDFANPTGGGGGVAYFAHIGGFVFGLLAIRAFASRVKRDYDGPRFPVY